MKKYASRIYLCIIFAILYIPILTLILFSFNASESTANFTGFSFDWYLKLFKDEEAFIALRNTLILAILIILVLITNTQALTCDQSGKLRGIIIGTVSHDLTQI